MGCYRSAWVFGMTVRSSAGFSGSVVGHLVMAGDVSQPLGVVSTSHNVPWLPGRKSMGQRSMMVFTVTMTGCVMPA